MKKTVFLAIFFLLALASSGFNATQALAYDAGCVGGNLFSTLTGMPCNSQASYYSDTNNSAALPPGCYGYNQNSVINGEPCYSVTSYPQTNYNFTRELGRGSRGEDVVMLQQLLKSEGYFFGRIDGVYGSITRRAVLDFQADNDLPQTGRADWQTLNILNNSITVPPIYPIDPIYSPPCYPYYYSGSQFQYPYPCGTDTPSISGVSGPQHLAVNQEGAWTISAFDQSGDALSYSVDWGEYKIFPYSTFQSPLTIAQQISTFTHRYFNPGVYTVTFTVTNMQGVSAKSTITVNVTGNLQTIAPTIQYLSPSSGRIGTQVAIYGSGFTFEGNTVNFGSTTISNLTSLNGTSIIFNVPLHNPIIADCIHVVGIACDPVILRDFNVYVTNAYGTSNSASFRATY